MAGFLFRLVSLMYIPANIVDCHREGLGQHLGLVGGQHLKVPVHSLIRHPILRMYDMFPPLILYSLVILLLQLMYI